MREIPLTQGKVALVDDEDYDALAAFKWHARLHPSTFYAQRTFRCLEGGWGHEQMHRAILARKLGRALVEGEETDHENGDGLDNRRDNLRLATKAQNMRNCKRRAANPSSRYLGVNWHKRDKRWGVQIRINGTLVHIGYYEGELAAAEAREAFILARPELMARRNFPQQELGGTPCQG